MNMLAILRPLTVQEMARRSDSSRPWKVMLGVLSISITVNLALLWSLQSRCSSPLPVRTKGEPFDIQGVLPNGVIYGSAKLDGASHRRWFLGHFFPADNPRHFDDVSLKWSTNRQGATNGEVATNNVAHSLALLIRGKMQVEFPGANLTLSRLGDYTIWKPGIAHSWTALEDTITLAVRWPSLPNDQKSAESF